MAARKLEPLKAIDSTQMAMSTTISAGIRHTARLLYFGYQPAALMMKVWVLTSGPYDLNTEFFWTFIVFAGSLMPVCCIVAAQLEDSLSGMAIYLKEDPQRSNQLLKLQSYGILLIFMIPVLLFASTQAVAQNLIFTVLGFFAVFWPLLDDAETLRHIFGGYAALGLARVLAAERPHFTYAMKSIAACHLLEGAAIWVLLYAFDTGLRRQYSKDGRSSLQSPLDGGIPCAEEPLSSPIDGLLQRNSVEALNALEDIVRWRGGQDSLRRLLIVQERRLKRRDHVIGQLFLVLHVMRRWRLEPSMVANILDFARDDSAFFEDSAGCLGDFSAVSDFAGSASHVGQSSCISGSVSTVSRLQSLSRRLIEVL